MSASNKLEAGLSEAHRFPVVYELGKTAGGNHQYESGHNGGDSEATDQKTVPNTEQQGGSEGHRDDQE